MISRKEYNALKEAGINFLAIARKHLTDQEIDALGFEEVVYKDAKEGSGYANFSSFLWWHENTGGNVHEFAQRNIDILQDYDKLILEGARLHNKYVFLGTNAGQKAKGVPYEHFEMFQRRNTPSPYKYKTALIETENFELLNEIEGSYMTDLIKGFPTSYGPDIEKKIKEVGKSLEMDKKEIDSLRLRFVKVFEEILLNELSVFDTPTETIVCMGSKSSTLAKYIRLTNLEDKYNIVFVDHYTASGSYERRANSLKRIYTKEKSSYSE